MKNSTLLLAMCILLSSTASFAQPGSLDTSFSNDGVVRTTVGYLPQVSSVSIQADGKIVVSGWTYDVGSGFSDFALVRYFDYGRKDSAFGHNGIVTTDFQKTTILVVQLRFRQMGRL